LFFYEKKKKKKKKKKKNIRRPPFFLQRQILSLFLIFAATQYRHTAVIKLTIPL